MKVLAIFAITSVVAIYALPSPHHDKSHQNISPATKDAIDKCATDMGLTKEQVKEKLQNREKSDCFKSCIMKGLGIFDEEGKVNKEKAIEHFEPYYTSELRKKEVVDICAEKKGADHCETAALIHQCSEEHVPKSKFSEIVDAEKSCKTKLEWTDEQYKNWAKNRNNLTDKDCFRACMLEELGAFNESGALDSEKAIAKMNPLYIAEGDKQKITECSVRAVKADKCETAASFYNCLRETKVIGSPSSSEST